ncbi:hypothetical protein [Ralstonia phage RP31]|uniref:Protein kinase domain-containing protein n=2 Tax=Ripduovirus RP12 TaxID=2560700 RepID=A0A1L7N109_9CAUD|nr:hypothetical protein FDH28_gp235 [Ralstonia phage RP12]BAW19160.1 hypothetical protein [Ralstonia phage RP12]BAW19446.1 hypothetical protein [Ralstonia phage RP31]
MAWFQIKSGSRRFVFVFKKRVIKIPKFTSWLSFILGVMENLHERSWWCADSTVQDPDLWYDEYRSTNHLAQIYWADRFGLCVVMERVDTLEHLEKEYERCSDPEYLRCAEIIENRYKNLDFLTDLKPSNIGIRPDGRVVMVDYGYFRATQQWCLGNKVIIRKKELPEQRRNELRERMLKLHASRGSQAARMLLENDNVVCADADVEDAR